MKTAVVTAMSAAVLAAVMTANSAYAGGFLADLGVAGGFIDRDQADVLDDMHEGLGNPLDNIVPGNGFEPAQPQSQWQPPQPRWQPPQPMAMGNFCWTPYGVFGPGPLNPVGTPCFAGNIQGVVR